MSTLIIPLEKAEYNALKDIIPCYEVGFSLKSHVHFIVNDTHSDYAIIIYDGSGDFQFHFLNTYFYHPEIPMKDWDKKDGFHEYDKPMQFTGSWRKLACETRKALYTGFMKVMQETGMDSEAHAFMEAAQKDIGIVPE